MGFIREIIRRPHPAIVHFPIALFPLSFLFLVLYWLTASVAYLSASYWTFLVSAAIIIPTAITGFIDMKRLQRLDSEAAKHLNKHLVNGIAITLISVATGLLFLWQPPFHHPFLFTIYTLDVAVLSILSMYQGYLGATMVYDHHLGVEGDTR